MPSATCAAAAAWRALSARAAGETLRVAARCTLQPGRDPLPLPQRGVPPGLRQQHLRTLTYRARPALAAGCRRAGASASSTSWR
jgi:hypothetical protein